MARQDLSSKRMADFRRVLKQAGLDGYITLAPLEQRYLSGIELSAGEAVFLITPKKAYCITKKLIVSKMTPAAAFLKTEDVPFGGMLDGALAKVKKLGLKTVAFDPAQVDFMSGEKLLKEGFSRAEGLVGELRLQKYEDEITKLKKACKIAAEAFSEVQPKIKTGMTEEEVRVLMALAMIKRGADSIPFNIVCFGENTADAHHTPSKTRKLKASEAVLMDFGCFYEGYTSDMTRSWWHGKNEPAEYTKIWNIVDKARKAGVKALRKGVSAAEVDAAARQVIEAAGYGKEFFHTTGHAIGLEEHDRPILRAGSPELLDENYVVTVEPGIYFENKWGIRLEDSFLVTKTGSKKLTQK
ncbi:MAG: aminopeptidase P family protein [Elusimicrobiaceae bacterium]|nr:aminopeptidase P family protein [Elusimicrobiaceae bacterium]